jgi:hypothetical protein
MRTFDDLYHLSKTNLTVANCLAAFRLGHVTRDQTLIDMIFFLVETNNELIEEAVKNHTRTSTHTKDLEGSPALPQTGSGIGENSHHKSVPE